MGKTHLTLYITDELVKLAKQTGLNLSQEFESWLNIRCNTMANDVTENKKDTELLIAEHLAEIKRLQSQAEVEKEKKDKGSEENTTIDFQIDNMVEYKESLTEPDQARVTGLQFLFKKRYNKILNPLQAKDLLVNRAKERGLI